MSLRNILSGYSRVARREASVRPPDQGATVPKNGRLTLAVLGMWLLTGILGFFNYRFINDSSMAGRLFGRSPAATDSSNWNAGAASGTMTDSRKSHHVPPKVTFYSELTESDDDRDDSPYISEDDSSPASPGPSGSSVKAAVERPESVKERSAAGDTSRIPPSSPPNSRIALPEAGKGPKVYTVQVGAFTNPGIAQQWAQEWKAKGYDVSLKPVARPTTGVIYRLYLGEFTSEKTADELVKRLRQKEGISAMRLVVRK